MAQDPLHDLHIPPRVDRYGVPLAPKVQVRPQNDKMIRILLVVITLTCILIGGMWIMRFDK